MINELNFNYRGTDFSIIRTKDLNFHVFCHSENRQVTDDANPLKTCSAAVIFAYHYEDQRILDKLSNQISIFDILEEINKCTA